MSEVSLKEEKVLDVPVNAKVECIDGPGGRSTYVVVDYMAQQVTHLVVKGNRTPHTEFIVTIKLVEETTPTLIRLGCTRDDLEKMEHFIQHQYIWMTDPTYRYSTGAGSWMLPYAIPAEKKKIVIEHENLPPGELAVKRGAHVEATDGRVGRVDEFLVDPETGHITHLVMREGHLLDQKEVAIPLSEVDRMREETVYLILDKAGVHELPAIPVRRWVQERSHATD